MRHLSDGIYEELDEILEVIRNYVLSTYGEHYKGTGLQQIDIWKARGTLRTTAVDTAEKYLFRYGKKDGFNEKDLLKAIHYIMMVLFDDHVEKRL